MLTQKTGLELPLDVVVASIIYLFRYKLNPEVSSKREVITFMSGNILHSVNSATNKVQIGVLKGFCLSLQQELLKIQYANLKLLMSVHFTFHPR